MKYLTGALILLFSTVLSAQQSMKDTLTNIELKSTELPSGVKISFSDQGAGNTTLVFIHGLGSNLKSWKKNIDSLSVHYRCISLDLPGYGGSSKEDYPFDMAFFAKAVIEFIKTEKLENVVLAGHSMGGQVALTALLEEPSIAQKLLLLAPAGFEVFTDAEKQWFSMIYTPEVVKSTPPEQIRKNFEMNFLQFPPDAEFMVEDRMKLRENTAEYDYYCKMIPQCVMGMLQQPVFNKLSEITTPTLVIYGEQDFLIPNRFLHKDLTTQQVAESGQKKLSNATLKMIPLAGHFVQWEGANLVNQTILEFVK